MYNYHSATAYAPILSDYPDPSERDRFLEAYIAHGRGAKDKEEAKLVLESEIKDWRAVNHAFWCVWGVVMSEDDPELILHENNSSEMETQVVSEEKPAEERESEGASAADFDYIAYADQKMRLFWGELASGRMFADYKDGIEGCKIIKD
jgi:thiamine kinase-like enzyme